MLMMMMMLNVMMMVMMMMREVSMSGIAQNIVKRGNSPRSVDYRMFRTKDQEYINEYHNHHDHHKDYDGAEKFGI